MVHIIKVALFASVAVLPALAAPLNAGNELIARSPAPAPRANFRGTASRVNSVVSRVGSTAGRIGSVARKVNSVVSTIGGLFGRELDSEEELVLREFLEELHAREPAPRANLRRTASRVNSVVSRVGSTAGRVGSVARRVGSVVSTIGGLFGRELDSDDELFIRDLLEDFHARGLESAFDELDERELEDVEAREVFDEELD